MSCLLQVGLQVPPELIGLCLQIDLHRLHPKRIPSALEAEPVHRSFENSRCQTAVKFLPSKAVEMQTWCQNQEKRERMSFVV